MGMRVGAAHHSAFVLEDLDPGVFLSVALGDVCPLVHDLADLCGRHEREGDVTPGVEAHHLALPRCWFRP
jgi:hypothetical protein